jgi:hypothetical protein
LNNNFSNIFKSIKGSYNLLDFAQKPKGKPLPRTRASFNEEYNILNDYKNKIISRKKAIEKLIVLKNIDKKQAQKILYNISNNNITPMKFKV